MKWLVTEQRCAVSKAWGGWTLSAGSAASGGGRGGRTCFNLLLLASNLTCSSRTAACFSSSTAIPARCSSAPAPQRRRLDQARSKSRRSRAVSCGRRPGTVETVMICWYKSNCADQSEFGGRVPVGELVAVRAAAAKVGNPPAAAQAIESISIASSSYWSHCDSVQHQSVTSLILCTPIAQNLARS